MTELDGYETGSERVLGLCLQSRCMVVKALWCIVRLCVSSRDRLQRKKGIMRV